jgi:hypothetical protein
MAAMLLKQHSSRHEELDSWETLVENELIKMGETPS